MIEASTVIDRQTKNEIMEKASNMTFITHGFHQKPTELNPNRGYPNSGDGETLERLYLQHASQRIKVCYND